MAKGERVEARDTAAGKADTDVDGLLLDLQGSEFSNPLPDDAVAASSGDIDPLTLPDLVGAEESVVLTLDDLVPDPSGEVVLMTEDDLAVSLLAGQPVTDLGIAENHVTAGGVDVTGLHVYHIEGGITLYSPQDLVILPDG